MYIYVYVCVHDIYTYIICKHTCIRESLFFLRSIKLIFVDSCSFNTDFGLTSSSALSIRTLSAPRSTNTHKIAHELRKASPQWWEKCRLPTRESQRRILSVLLRATPKRHMDSLTNLQAYRSPMAGEVSPVNSRMPTPVTESSTAAIRPADTWFYVCIYVNMCVCLSGK